MKEDGGGDLSYVKDYRGFESGGSAYIKESFEYNSLGAPIKATFTDFANADAAGVKKEEYTITYDNNGYITAETAYTNYGTAKTVNKAYEYDAIGRLTKSTIDGEVTTYTYDKVGNRLTETSDGKTLTYAYNGLDQLLTIKEGAKTISTFTYDARGNQTGEETLAFTLAIGEEGTAGMRAKTIRRSRRIRMI